jgi:hypothetical protein
MFESINQKEIIQLSKFEILALNLQINGFEGLELNNSLSHIK